LKIHVIPIFPMRKLRRDGNTIKLEQDLFNHRQLVKAK